MRGGQTKTVRYTMRMINSRIGQYQREIKKAIKKGMNADILENRKRWLHYWQQKKAELLDKSGITATS